MSEVQLGEERWEIGSLQRAQHVQRPRGWRGVQETEEISCSERAMGRGGASEAAASPPRQPRPAHGGRAADRPGLLMGCPARVPGSGPRPR